MQKITPFLWFDGNAEEAVNFYVSVFKNSPRLSGSPAGRRRARPEGNFQLDGQEFFALKAGNSKKAFEAMLQMEQD
jgi:predicted 3-demethylubiquinone-9 3-methyltransferase (glyoxalase superfamily)